MKKAAESSPPGKFYFVNLGCPKNLVDAEITASILEDGGWERCGSMDEADLIAVTTCAFIEAAVEESIETILSVISSRRRGQKVAVLGCLVSREKGKIEKLIPEVDYFLDVSEMYELARVVSGGRDEVSPLDRYAYNGLRKRLFTPGHVGYLKISEGCSNHCSYCLIPSIRGEHRSYRKEDLIEEAKRLNERGVKELVVIAQDTAVWGSDIYDGFRLHDLLRELDRETEFEWIRLMYLHPAHMEAKKVAELIADGVIIPYLDIPIQHSSDRILKMMRRGYKRGDLHNLYVTLRENVRDLVLRTTVMVGFPSESEEDFLDLLDFIEEHPFEHLGAFTYSREDGTSASKMKGQVRKSVAEERLEEILSTQMDISSARLYELRGKRLKVIVDSYLQAEERPAERFHYSGRYYGQAYEIDGVTYLSGDNIMPGDVVEVLVMDSDPYNLYAEVVRVLY